LDAAALLLTPQQEQGVSVRIADQWSRPIILKRHGSGRDEADTRWREPVLQGWQIVDLERESPAMSLLGSGAGAPRMLSN
jgi:hypothetical protein